MEVRALGEDDAAAWWRLRLESLNAEPFAFGKSPEEHRAIAVESIAQRFREAPACDLHLGAFENGVLIGMATFLRERGAKDRHKGRIYGVYVSAAHRGHGAGRALLARIFDFASRDSTLEQILISVATTQSAARALYQSFGFEPYGIEPRALKIGDRYIDEEHRIAILRRPPSGR